jgi:hypothetical protein
VSDRLADGPTRGEKEEINVWIDLGDNTKIDVEVEVEGFERNVSAEGAVFPFVTEGVGYECSFSGLHHQDDWVQDTWHSS